MLAGVGKDHFDSDFNCWTNVNTWMPEFHFSGTIFRMMRAVDDQMLTRTYPNEELCTSRYKGVYGGISEDITDLDSA